MSSLREMARDLLPPIVLRAARRSPLLASQRSVFTGDHASWEEARAASTGYDAQAILDRVLAAALRVKRGEAAFERDSVCFPEPEYRWPVLAALLLAAARRGGRLGVVDLGGSLGSTWFQHRALLSGLPEVRWWVVEQPHFVEAGRRELEDGVLRFRGAVEDCLSEGPVDAILLSSVLPYVERPHDLLGGLARHGVPLLVVDRTGFVPGDRDRLMVQRVPPSIYAASYPAWFLSRSRFDRTVAAAGYRILGEFGCDDDAGIGEYRGMVLERTGGSR